MTERKGIGIEEEALEEGQVHEDAWAFILHSPIQLSLNLCTLPLGLLCPARSSPRHLKNLY